MKLHTGIVLLNKGDWMFGIVLEKDTWDGSISGSLSIFKIDIWFRMGLNE